MTGRPANFGLMFARGMLLAFYFPLLVFSAPYILIRNAYRAFHNLQVRPSSLILVCITAVVWSIVCGRIVLLVLPTV